MRDLVDAHILDAKKCIAELSGRCITSMDNREFSKLSKLPAKVMCFVNAMNWRMKECAEAAVLLLESHLTHPAIMLIRSSMENVAITIKLADVIRGTIGRSEVDGNDDFELMRLLFANKYRKNDPFKDEEDDLYRAEPIARHIDKAQQLYPGFQDFYSFLCEFVHPNSDGVTQSYSFLHEDDDWTSFGPILNKDVELCDAFTSALVLSLTAYLEQVEYIDTKLPPFIHLCDDAIVKKHRLRL